jgi:hypothetical protein
MGNGASSDVAEDIKNEYRYGEGEINGYGIFSRIPETP